MNLFPSFIWPHTSKIFSCCRFKNYLCNNNNKYIILQFGNVLENKTSIQKQMNKYREQRFASCMFFKGKINPMNYILNMTKKIFCYYDNEGTTSVDFVLQMCKVLLSIFNLCSWIWLSSGIKEWFLTYVLMPTHFPQDVNLFHCGFPDLLNLWRCHFIWWRYVDDFDSVFLSCTFIYAPSDHAANSPVQEIRNSEQIQMCQILN